MESVANRKRKIDETFSSGETSSRFPLNELNQDVLERVLSCLPTSSFLRLNSVCKRWKSVSDSTTFKLACAQVQSRDPWFLMVDTEPGLKNQTVVFDSSERNWKKLNRPPPVLHLTEEHSCSNSFIPVSASGGLVCFHNQTGDFIVNNPVTGSSRPIRSLEPVPEQLIQAIAMMTSSSKPHSSFKLVLLSGELSKLKFKEYNSLTDQWSQETALTRKTEPNPVQESKINDHDQEYNDDEEFPHYFLSKCGNVISTGMQRSPCKQYSSLLTLKNGEELLHFLSSSGSVVRCNLTRKFFFEYPRLLPVFSEYSIDLVECGGEVYVVLLSEFLETASLRVWKWDECERSWDQVAAMPPAMSHALYGNRVDVNCSPGAAREKMLVCLSGVDVCSYVLCDLKKNEWVELSGCGGGREFVCAFSFEPRIEASVY